MATIRYSNLDCEISELAGGVLLTAKTMPTTEKGPRRFLATPAGVYECSRGDAEARPIALIDCNGKIHARAKALLEAPAKS